MKIKTVIATLLITGLLHSPLTAQILHKQSVVPTLHYLLEQVDMSNVDATIVVKPMSFFSQNKYYYTYRFSDLHVWSRLFDQYVLTHRFSTDMVITDGDTTGTWSMPVFCEVKVFNDGEFQPWYSAKINIKGLSRVWIECHVQNTDDWELDFVMDNGTEQLPFTLNNHNNLEVGSIVTEGLMPTITQVELPDGWTFDRVEATHDFHSHGYPSALNTIDQSLRQVTLSLSNWSSYRIKFYNKAPGPEMDVEGNRLPIPSGDTTPSIQDCTDFGSTTVNSGAVEQRLSINNTGQFDLTLNGTPDKVTLSGDHASDFTITTQPVSPLGSLRSCTFKVTFAPTATGLRTATVSIASNDVDENPYTFTIQGTGEVSLPVTLSSFSAKPAPPGVRVAWTTESETDNLGFILERCEIGWQDWACIASHQTHPDMRGLGNSSEQHEYTFIDVDIDAGQSYAYRLSDVNTSGEVHVYDVIEITLPEAPAETILAPPFPNPFNPQTKISYQLAESGPVEISVYDLLGRKIRVLVDEVQSAGSYNMYWHGDDASSRNVATGTYLIVLTTVEGVKTQKVVMMR
ncbi:choice-of-anchor D domain-containing protein [bacterium]|nr:choice-of-anchor D domain-containing protein [bacterium]